MLRLAQLKKAEQGCFKFLRTSGLTSYWSHRERQRSMMLETCFGLPTGKTAHSTTDKLRPLSNRLHSGWQSCSSNYRVASFLLSTKARKMWLGHAFGVTFKHLRMNSGWLWSRIVALFTGEHKACQKACLLPKCCKAASAWSTSKLAHKNWEPQATDPEHMGRERQLWNLCWTLTCRGGEDIPLPPWCSHALFPHAIWPRRIRG